MTSFPSDSEEKERKTRTLVITWFGIVALLTIAAIAAIMYGLNTPVSLKEHQAPVNSLGFSLDDLYLASCAADGTVYLWGVPGR